MARVKVPCLTAKSETVDRDTEVLTDGMRMRIDVEHEAGLFNRSLIQIVPFTAHQTVRNI